MWSTSPYVAEILGISYQNAKQLGRVKGLWQENEHKPSKPKRLLEEVLHQKGKSKSASWFGKLAQKVGIDRCSDTSFCALKDTLREWFPAKEEF